MKHYVVPRRIYASNRDEARGNMHQVSLQAGLSEPHIRLWTYESDPLSLHPSYIQLPRYVSRNVLAIFLKLWKSAKYTTFCIHNFLLHLLFYSNLIIFHSAHRHRVTYENSAVFNIENSKLATTYCIKIAHSVY